MPKYVVYVYGKHAGALNRLHQFNASVEITRDGQTAFTLESKSRGEALANVARALPYGAQVNKVKDYKPS